MSRPQPKSEPPEVKRWSQGGHEREIGGTSVIVQTRSYKLITPLFGGGVEPGVNDPITLIRGSEIRGQLRFWWRATRGGQFNGDLEAMKKRENEIWGAASNTEKKNLREKNAGSDENKKQQGAVQIIVDVVKRGTSVDLFEVVEKKNKRGFDAKLKNLKPDYDKFLGYIVFPLQPSREELEKARKKEDVLLKTIQKDVAFTLNIVYPQKLAEEIEGALWAWETFGGVGARTRRGFGALLLEQIDGKDVEDGELPPADSHEARAWIHAKLLQYAGVQGEKRIAHVPRLDLSANMRNMRVLEPSQRSMDAWGQLIDPLYSFRQQRFDFRQQRPSPFGKSLWPEANALRRCLHLHDKGASTPDKFPRAAFGLPIVFHLAHEHPAQTITLQGMNGNERWASRLILKPIPCREKQFLGLAILLDGSELPGEELALMREGKQWETISAKQTQLKAGELPELKEVIDDEIDMLLAFLNYLKKEGK